jgi:AcrR family transcriptional regulator
MAAITANLHSRKDGGMAGTQNPEDEPDSWRAHAVDRVVGPARQKAEERLQRFLDAAVELARSSAGTDFSVQDVVERSGQSLRSFYEYFDGKHELLLALLDSSVRSLAAELEETIAPEQDPFERLHLFCIDFYRLCRTDSAAAHRASMTTLGFYALQLFRDHPRAAMRAFAELNNLCDRLVREALDAGAIRTDVPVPRVVAAVLQAIMFNHFALSMAEEAPVPVDVAAEEIWQQLLLGLQSRPATAAPRAPRKAAPRKAAPRKSPPSKAAPRASRTGGR